MLNISYQAGTNCFFSTLGSAKLGVIDFLVDDFPSTSLKEKENVLDKLKDAVSFSKCEQVEIRVGVISYIKSSSVVASYDIRNIVEALGVSRQIHVSIHIQSLYKNDLERSEVDLDLFRYIFEGFEGLASRVREIFTTSDQRLYSCLEIKGAVAKYFPRLHLVSLNNVLYDNLAGVEWKCSMSRLSRQPTKLLYMPTGE
jgi:hypothetical protein